MGRRKLAWPSSCPPSPDGLAGQVAWLWDYFAREAGENYNYARDEGQLFPPLTRGEALSMTVALRDAIKARGATWPIATDLIAAQMDDPLPGVITYLTTQRRKPYRHALRMWDAWRSGAESVRAIANAAPLELPPPTKEWCASIAREATARAARDAGRKIPDPRKVFPRLPGANVGWVVIAVIAALVAKD